MTLESIPRAEGLAGSGTESGRFHPSIALAPFVEALVVGRRVAVFGDSSLELPDALLGRGARLVHAYDPDAARVAEAIARRAPAFGGAGAGRPAARGVVHAILGDDLGVRDGAFDAVLIPDLSLFADRDEVVRRARKLVAPAGAVVVASPNPDAKRRLVAGSAGASAGAGGRAAPGYYEIFDLLSLQFPVVRMVGPAPFVGYAIVDFAPDREPDVSFDASLMAGTEEPETFVAIASERPISTDPYLVVEVPSADVLGAMGALAAGAGADDARGPASAQDVRQAGLAAGGQVQLAEMQARVVLMEAELDDLRGKKSALERELDAAREAAEQADLQARQASAEGAARLRESERSAAIEAERWKDLEARAGDEHVRAERLTHKVRDLEEELVRQRDRSQKLTKQLDDEKRSRQKAEIELGMAKGLPKPEESAEAEARASELEARAGEAEARVAEVTAELHRARAHADSLASELLAKSKETAELRRGHEAAEHRNVELEREIGAARAKAAAAATELSAVKERLDEMEEQAQTMRRPQPVREPVVVTGEVQSGMVARITRLEATANADREAAEQAQRDAEAARREAEVAERKAERAAVERDAATARAGSLEKALEEERTARKDLVIAKAALESEVLGLKKKLEEALAEREAEAGPEVAGLEAALRDRGHKIAGLERDLRESERIGRELIAEIEGMRALAGEGEGGAGEGGFGGGGAGGASGAGGPVSGARGSQGAHGSRGGAVAGGAQASSRGVDTLTADAFQHRIDALAADAAQKQAELLTAGLKIQALEREVAGARAVSADPGTAQRELAAALVRAQSEIADLRRSLTLQGGDAGAPRAVVENAVLLQQAHR